MSSKINMNFRRYLLGEMVYIGALVLFLYWASEGINRSVLIFVFIIALITAVKVLMVWKCRGGLLEIKNDRLFYNGKACEARSLSAFLPFGMGSALKITYGDDVLKKRTLYLPKGVIDDKEWPQLFACRTEKSRPEK